MKLKSIIKKGLHYQVWYTPIQIKWYDHKEMKEYEKECKYSPGFGRHVAIYVYKNKYEGKPIAKYRGLDFDDIEKIK